MSPTRGPLVFPKSPKKNPPQNQPNRALQDELLSAGMPEAEVQPGDPTEKSGFAVAEIVGKFANLNGEQLKLHVFFFFRFKLCTRISLLGWILKEIMWLGWILKCVFGGISCDAWEACLRPDKCDMFHGRKLSCDIGGLCVGVIQTDWSPPEWWIAKPPAGS